MTYKISTKKVLLSKAEVTYGTDPVPTAANAMLVSNVTLKPMAASTDKRQRAHPNFGADLDHIAALYRTLQFDIEMGASGAAGTAALYDCLMQACGMSSTNSADVSQTYAPISSGQPSATEYFFWDGLKAALVGSRGNLKMAFAGAQLPQFTFMMSGLYSALTDTAAPDVHTEEEAFINAQEVNLANTVFTLGGFSAVMDKLDLDIGNSVIFRNRPNASYIALTDRKGTGSVTIEATTVAAKDWFSLAASDTTVALNLVQGTTAGNIITVAAPKVQLGTPDFTDLNGVLGLTIPLTLVRTAGDDEFSIVMT